MIKKWISNISSNERFLTILRILGWSLAIILIILSLMLMQDKEITFIYNNF